MKKIKEMFDEIPIEYNGLTVFSKIQREVYYKVLEYKVNKILKPIYDKLITK